MSVTDDTPATVAGPERLFVRWTPPAEYRVTVEARMTTAGPVWTRWVDSHYAERRAAAADFARRARYLPGVREVWLREALPEVEVAVIVRDLDLDRELALRGIFIDVMCERFETSVGELRVFAESEGIPDWLRDGDQLV